MGRRFHDAVVQWFEASFASPTRAQELGWPEIQKGHSTLVFAPTGSGLLDGKVIAIDPGHNSKWKTSINMKSSVLAMAA